MKKKWSYFAINCSSVNQTTSKNKKKSLKPDYLFFAFFFFKGWKNSEEIFVFRTSNSIKLQEVHFYTINFDLSGNQGVKYCKFRSMSMQERNHTKRKRWKMRRRLPSLARLARFKFGRRKAVRGETPLLGLAGRWGRVERALDLRNGQRQSEEHPIYQQRVS